MKKSITKSSQFWVYLTLGVSGIGNLPSIQNITNIIKIELSPTSHQSLIPHEFLDIMKFQSTQSGPSLQNVYVVSHEKRRNIQKN